jgi:hypothetical protein
MSHYIPMEVQSALPSQKNIVYGLKTAREIWDLKIYRKNGKMEIVI